MSNKTETFDYNFEKLEKFLKNVNRKSGEKAKEYLKELKKTHNKLRRDYHKKLTSNTFFRKLLKSKGSNIPKKSKTNNADLKERAFDYCIEELKDFLVDVKDGKELNKEIAKRCLICLEDIHDNLDSHYNACKEKGSCQETRTQFNGCHYDWRKHRACD